LVEKLKDLKDELLMQAEQDMHESGSVDPKTIDSIKDLAEAEKSCWEAEYYRSVTEAMEDGKMGYDDGMGYGRGGSRSGYARGGNRSGYNQGGYDGQGGRRGYERESRRGYRGRDSMGRYTSRRGYRRMDGYGHQDMLAEIRQMMETADPQEREQLRVQLRQMMSEM